MKIRELMTQDPEACLPSETCLTAGRIMARRNCGFVPVVRDRETLQVVGVLTDRDIALHLTRENVPPAQALVRECMTREPKTVPPEGTLEQATELMESAAVHRLPVVEGDRLIGVLALKDIAVFARQGAKLAGDAHAEERVAEIVEAISTAR